MKILEFKNPDGTPGCSLVWEDGLPVEPVMDFLQRNSLNGGPETTMKEACRYLMSFYEFLEESGKQPEDARIDDIQDYAKWLFHLEDGKQIALFGDSAENAVESVDKCMDTVMKFLYDQLFPQ